MLKQEERREQGYGGHNGKKEALVHRGGEPGFWQEGETANRSPSYRFYNFWQ